MLERSPSLLDYFGKFLRKEALPLPPQELMNELSSVDASFLLYILNIVRTLFQYNATTQLDGESLLVHVKNIASTYNTLNNDLIYQFTKCTEKTAKGEGPLFFTKNKAKLEELVTSFNALNQQCRITTEWLEHLWKHICKTEVDSKNIYIMTYSSAAGKHPYGAMYLELTSTFIPDLNSLWASFSSKYPSEFSSANNTEKFTQAYNQVRQTVYASSSLGALCKKEDNTILFPEDIQNMVFDALNVTLQSNAQSITK